MFTGIPFLLTKVVKNLRITLSRIFRLNRQRETKKIALLRGFVESGGLPPSMKRETRTKHEAKGFYKPNVFRLG